MDLEKYGITIKRTPERGPAYRLTRILKLPGTENLGAHHAFVRVWDDRGRRIEWHDLRIISKSPKIWFYALDKPDSPLERGHGDAPLYAGTIYDISIADTRGHASDVVCGLHTGHPDEDPGNTWGHHSFYMEFTLAASPEGPGEPAPPPDDERAALRAWLAEADDLMPQLDAWLKSGRALAE